MSRRHRVLAIATAAALAMSIAPAPAALADGDPASDVLATKSLFLPWDAGLSDSQQSQLAALIAAAQRSAVPVRVAIITSASDMGSVSALWRAPRAYASFLGEELSLLYRGPLVVVMPDGFGVFDRGGRLNRAERTIESARAPATSASGLLGAASSVVRQLAAAAGRPIGRVTGTTTERPPGPGIATWLTLAVGAGLIGAAWTASMRVRPLRAHGQP